MTNLTKRKQEVSPIYQALSQKRDQNMRKLDPHPQILEVCRKYSKITCKNLP